MNDHRSSATSPYFRHWVLAAVFLTVLMAGCQQSEQRIDTRYGLSTRAAQSLNSTSIFVQKVRSAGHYVKVSRRITPSIEDFDVVIWMPDNSNAPSDIALDALELWLDGYSDRTMIYVGRHYDAEAEYMEAVVAQSSGEKKEEVLRRIAEKEVSDADLEYQWWAEPREDCRWFTTEGDLRTKSNKLGGTMVQSMPAKQYPELTYSVRLEAVDNFQPFAYYSSEPWEKEVLLQVDGKPFVSKLTTKQNYSTSSIILVSNGCFLLNFGLIDSRKEFLADQLIAELPPTANVLVLESGPEDIPVSDTDYENHNSWAWIAEPPLRYIIPQFLIWGVVFCFVYFPIFGRPRGAERENTTSFRNHIDAIARQFARSGGIRRAREVIQNYIKLAGDRGKR